jgi:hypothetical protein
MKEWLLVIWLGTSSNFMIRDVFWNWQECDSARRALLPSLSSEYVLVCTQDMREGRSQLPPREPGIGIVK